MMISRALALGIASVIVGCAHVETPRERALLLLAHGRIPQGIVELEKLRDAHPDDPQAHIDLGHGYELAHRYDEALAEYDRAAEVKKTDPAARARAACAARRGANTRPRSPGSRRPSAAETRTRGRSTRSGSRASSAATRRVLGRPTPRGSRPRTAIATPRACSASPPSR
ncbi:MAG: hypothetical protein IPJ34_09500 [Myxococcales bacterium]|nr:hypothetical protein [Myxococcales bacterium]